MPSGVKTPFLGLNKWRYSGPVLDRLKVQDFIDDNEKIDTAISNLSSQNMTQVFLEDFGAIGDGVTDDTVAIASAIAYCITNKHQLKVKNRKAIFCTTDKINITGEFFTDFNNATIKATATMDALFYFRSANTSLFKATINNVVLDGGIYADKVMDISDSNTLCDNIKVINGLSYGIHVHNDGAVVDTGNAIIRNASITRTSAANAIETNAIGLYAQTSDGHYDRIVISQYKTGYKTINTNMFTRIHVWSTDTSILSNTVGFEISGSAETNAMLTQCYFDTCATMIKVTSNDCNLRLNECTSFYNSYHYSLARGLPIPTVFELADGVTGENISSVGCTWTGMYYFGAKFCNKNNNLINVVGSSGRNIRDFISNKHNLIENYNSSKLNCYLNKADNATDCMGKIQLQDGSLYAELVNGNFADTTLNSSFSFVNATTSIENNVLTLNQPGGSALYGRFKFNNYVSEGDVIFVSFKMKNLTHSIVSNEGSSVLATKTETDADYTKKSVLVKMTATAGERQVWFNIVSGASPAYIKEFVIVNLTKSKFLFFELENYSESLNRIVSLNTTWWEGTRTYPLLNTQQVCVVSHPDGYLMDRANFTYFGYESANIKTVLINGGFRVYNKNNTPTVSIDVLPVITYLNYQKVNVQKYIDNPNYVGSSPDEQIGGINLYLNGIYDTMLIAGHNDKEFLISPSVSCRLSMVLTYSSSTTYNYDIGLLSIHDNGKKTIKSFLTKNDGLINAPVYKNGLFTLSPTVENELFIANIDILAT